MKGPFCYIYHVEDATCSKDIEDSSERMTFKGQNPEEKKLEMSNTSELSNIFGENEYVIF